MELALLPPIILAIAEQRSLDAVLSSIAIAVASQTDVGLARVWLRDTDRSCPVCAGRTPASDEEALHQVEEPLRYQRELGLRVHEQCEPVVTVKTLTDDSPAEVTDGDWFGSVPTVTRKMQELRELGFRKVIGWFHFGNMPHERVRQSMRRLSDEVMPAGKV